MSNVPYNEMPVLPPTAALRAIRAILADGRLTPAQRVAAAAVVCQADAATGCAWASYRQLRREFGLSPTAIASALRSGEPAGAAIGTHLAAAATGERGAQCFRVLGAALRPTERMRSAERSASATPSEALRPGERYENEAPALRLGASSATPSVAILTPDSNPSFSNPPSPPPGGGAGAVSLEEATERVAQAYRAAMGRGLPWRWRRQVAREFRRGDPATVLAIDAAAIEAGRRLAAERGRTFGFGWVLQALAGRDDAAGRQRAADEARRREADAHRNADAQAQREREAQAARLAAFRALPAERREEWLEQARAMNPYLTRAERIEEQAAWLAAGVQR